MSNIPELPTLNSKPLNASHQYIEVKINLIKQKAWTIKISIKIHIISIPYETFLEQHILKMSTKINSLKAHSHELRLTHAADCCST